MEYAAHELAKEAVDVEAEEAQSCLRLRIRTKGRELAVANGARREEELRYSVVIAIWLMTITLQCALREQRIPVLMHGEPRSRILAMHEQTGPAPSAGCARCQAMKPAITC